MTREITIYGDKEILDLLWYILTDSQLENFLRLYYSKTGDDYEWIDASTHSERIIYIQKEKE